MDAQHTATSCWDETWQFQVRGFCSSLNRLYKIRDNNARMYKMRWGRNLGRGRFTPCNISLVWQDQLRKSLQFSIDEIIQSTSRSLSSPARACSNTENIISAQSRPLLSYDTLCTQFLPPHTEPDAQSALESFHIHVASWQMASMLST